MDGVETVKKYGAQDMVSPLRKVLVKRPDRAFEVKDPKKWHYTSRPNLYRSTVEHDYLVNQLKQHNVQVYYHSEYYPELADSIFVFDPVLITKKGAVILRMGKVLRRGEEDAMEKCLTKLGIPILYRLDGDATAEGGDTVWLDENTLLVGQGYRTNAEGLKQLQEALDPIGVDVIGVDLPNWEGKDACLHLMSLISPVDVTKAVVYKKLLPVKAVKLLEERGYTFIEVPDEEFLTMGPNVLTIRPGLVVALNSNPITIKRMEQSGIRVIKYRGDEISHKAEGGPTCLTRPLLREF